MGVQVGSTPLHDLPQSQLGFRLRKDGFDLWEVYMRGLQGLLPLSKEYIFRSTKYFSVCVKSSSLLYFMATVFLFSIF